MKRIDIQAVLKAKNPALARWVPRFAVRWVERLVCADRLNEILDRYSDRDPIGFIDGALGYIGVTYQVHGAENIPTSQKVLFAANHPLGGVDGMILAAAVDKIRPDVRLIVNDILLNIEPLRPIFVGVNKHGGQDCSFALRMDELYASDSPIINFPAGLCSRRGADGVVSDPSWRKSFVPRSVASGRVVVPTYVRAFNSPWFYRVARWRTKLGIKANLEMILLPRQVFYQKGRTVDIFFGKPIAVDDSRSAAEWCELIRQRTYELWNNRS